MSPCRLPCLQTLYKYCWRHRGGLILALLVPTESSTLGGVALPLTRIDAVPISLLSNVIFMSLAQWGTALVGGCDPVRLPIDAPCGDQTLRLDSVVPSFNGSLGEFYHTVYPYRWSNLRYPVLIDIQLIDVTIPRAYNTHCYWTLNSFKMRFLHQHSHLTIIP